jgi:ABC-type polysaccharide/polyol phosphate export permease
MHTRFGMESRHDLVVSPQEYKSKQNPCPSEQCCLSIDLPYLNLQFDIFALKTPVHSLILLGAACFSIFSLIVGCLVKSRERFGGLGQLMSMLLFFASNAIYPISLMPPWLQVLSHLNPLTYQVDALRGVMLANSVTVYGFGWDCAILLCVVTVLTVICARLYPQLGM